MTEFLILDLLRVQKFKDVGARRSNSVEELLTYYIVKALALLQKTSKI